MVEGILVEGLIYSITAIGVFITFRVLNFPDLTVDGSFPLGAAIAAAMISTGYNSIFSLLVALVGGSLAGIITAAIHNRLGVPHLMAGIITMTMLWSINIRVLGNRANLPLVRVRHLLRDIRDIAPEWLPPELSLFIFFALTTAAIALLLRYFFITDLGLTLRAMGDNRQLVISAGMNPKLLNTIGVALSNGLVGLSGAFAAQYQGFGDVNLGQGIIISGLASVMIGEFLFRTRHIGLQILRVILGTIIYRAILYLGRFYGYYINLTPNDLRLITGLLIVASLIAAKLRAKRDISVKS